MSDMFPIDPDELDRALSDEESAEVPVDLAIQLDGHKVNGTKESAIRAGQVATMKGDLTDRATLEQTKSETDGRVAADRAAQARYDALLQENEEYLRNVTDASVEPEAVGSYLQQGAEQRSKLTTERAQPTSTERALVESVEVEADEQLRSEKEFQLAARNDISLMLDSQGLLDDVLDFSSYLVPFGEFKDILDAKETVQDIEGLSGSSIEAMVASFQSLPPERKQAVWPQLQTAIIEATSTDFGIFKTDGNLQKAAGILLQFLAPEGGEGLQDVATTDAVLSGLEFIPAGKLAKLRNIAPKTKDDMANVLKQAAHNVNRKNNAVKTAKDLGNGKAAAQTNLQAATDANVADAAGLDVQIARENFLPQNPDSFTPEKVEGLSVDLQKELNEFVSKSEGFTKSMASETDLMRIGALEQSERTTAVTNFIDRMNKKAEDLANEGIQLTNMRVVKADDKGITFDYDMVNTQDMQIIPDNVPTPTKTVKRPKEFKKQTRLRTEEQEIPLSPLAQNIRDTLAAGRKKAPVTHRGRVNWTINDVTGMYEETVESLTTNLAKTKVLSPSAFSKVGGGAGDFGGEVARAQQVSDLQAAIQTQVGQLWKDANKDIGFLDRKKVQRLEEIEIEGDEFIDPSSHERGRVFTPQELAQKGLTSDKLQRAYYKRRIVADQMHSIQNYATRRELELGGFGSTRVNGREIIAKMFESAESAAASARSRPNRRVYMQKEGKTAQLTPELIQQEYANGRRLVRTRRDFNTQAPNDEVPRGEFVEYIFINDNRRMKALPERVVGYHKGYVPKIQKDVEFVVRQVQPIRKTGDQEAGIRTALRAFSSRVEADEYIRRMIESRAAKENLTPDEAAKLVREYEVANNSVMTQVERMEGAVSSGNGLFTGTRAKSDLLKGLEGEPIERMSPSESFARYAQQIGKVIGRNEWRVGSEKRWLNTVRKLQQQGKLGKTRVSGFQDTALPNSPEGKALERLREQINAWNGQLDLQETMYQRMVQRLHDWVLGSNLKYGISEKLAVPLLKAKNMQPAQKLKSWNMHMYLGMFNPAQLYVQASNMAVSMSLLPNLGDAARHIPRIVGFQAMDYAGNDVGKLLTKGVVTAEDVSMHRLWGRTGLRDSIRNNADMAFTESSGMHPVGKAVTGVLDRGLVFYRGGEKVNRMSAFIAAARRWQDETGKAFDDVTDTELQTILTDTNRMLLNLNTANRAYWQGGQGTGVARETLGIMTQFMQVTAKTVELSFKGEKRGGFSLRDRGRILAGQALMFGGVGVPLSGLVLPAMSDLLGTSESPELVHIINQGLSGAMGMVLTGGAEIELASRASLLGGVVDTIKDVAFSREEHWKLLGGVSETNIERGANALGEFHALLFDTAPLMLFDNRGVEMTMAQAQQAAVSLMELPSSGNNLLKAYLMANHDRIVDRRGRPVIEEDFDLGEVMAQAAGFRLTDETRTRLIQMDNRAYDELVQESAQAIIDMHHDWVYRYGRDAEHGQLLLQKRQALLEGLDNDEIIQRVNELVERRIFESKDQSLKEREMLKFWERTLPDEVDAALFSERGFFSNIGAGTEQPLTQPFANLDLEGDE